MGGNLSDIDQRLPKNEIIKKHNDFKKILDQGNQWSGKYIKCFFCKAQNRKVGFMIAKNIGKAVTRNRIKRLMRESYRKNRQTIKNYHILICAKNQSVTAKYEDIYEDFQNFIKKHHDY